MIRIYHSGVVNAWRERDRQLLALGADVVLVTAKAWNEGGRVVSCSPGLDQFVHPVATFGRHPYRFVFNPLPLLRLLRQKRFDIIDVHEEPASLAHLELRMLARLSGHRRTPMLFYGAQNIEKRYPIPFRWFEQGAFRRSAASYVCTIEAGEIFRRKGFAGAVELIGLGVDIDRFGSGEPHVYRSPLRVGYVGRLEEHKGIQVVLQALRGSEHHLSIVGDGPHRAHLEHLVSELGLDSQVSFKGFVSSDALPATYQDFDAIVVPSQTRASWVEQFGRVAVEAMASGIPVLVSRSGSLPEVVGDAGLVVAADDPRAWRAALDEIAANPFRRLLMSNRGRERASTFSWSSIAGRHLKLYRTVLS